MSAVKGVRDRELAAMRRPATNVAAIDDPAERARAATALLAELTSITGEVAALRLEAARELRAAGSSFGELAALLGVSKGRAAQLLDVDRASG